MNTDLKTNLNVLGNKVYDVLVNIAVAIYVLDFVTEYIQIGL